MHCSAQLVERLGQKAKKGGGGTKLSKAMHAAGNAMRAARQRRASPEGKAEGKAQGSDMGQGSTVEARMAHELKVTPLTRPLTCPSLGPHLSICLSVPSDCDAQWVWA